MTSFACLIKSAVGIFYVYIVFLICYLPLFICLVAIETVDNPSIALKRFFLFSSTLVFLNSSLNPVIYCWKMRHIRQAVLNLLRSISRRNWTSPPTALIVETGFVMLLYSPYLLLLLPRLLYMKTWLIIAVIHTT